MIHLIAGPMFAGKTQELIRIAHHSWACGFSAYYPWRATRGKEGWLASRSGGRIPAVPFRHLSTITENFDPNDNLHKVLLLDEVHFIPPDDMREFLERLHPEVLVYCAGVTSDQYQKTYEVISVILGRARRVSIITARCHQCMGEATYTKRLSNLEADFVVGDKDDYEARCGPCWNK